MSLKSTSNRHFGHNLKEHTLIVPWDPQNASAGSFELYAREIYADGNENKPAIVYLQGGPGFPAPRPFGGAGKVAGSEIGGVVGKALEEFRFILLDQRGTGRSHRIDNASPAEDLSVERLSKLQQNYIVDDAEALRKALGIEKWSLFGQSFGGFCITSYLSRYPEAIEHAYLTGGLPATSVGIDDVYRSTFDKVRARHHAMYREYPWIDQRIREVCHHLDQSQELLPTGERLSARRLRTIGITLGQGPGFHTLAYLFEDPFRTVGGEKRLKTDFLTSVGGMVSFADGPLYAAIHESIYGGVVTPGATNWSAHRIREEIPGFEENADPRSQEPFYLTGEHVFPWQFDEDPALHAFRQGAHDLAQYNFQTSPYDREILATAPVSAAAAYFDDMYVPFELSYDTARAYADCRLHVTNLYQHDGIGYAGAEIFDVLRDKVRDF